MKINLQVPAPFSRRLLAYLIDIIIVFFIIITPFYYNIDKSKISNATYLIKPEFSKTEIFTTIVIAVLTILYWAVFEFFFNQSIGKMITKIQVISLNKHLNFSQTLLRNLSKFSTLILILDCIPIIFKRSTQRYLEKMSNTQVTLK